MRQHPEQPISKKQKRASRYYCQRKRQDEKTREKYQLMPKKGFTKAKASAFMNLLSYITRKRG